MGTLWPDQEFHGSGEHGISLYSILIDALKLFRF